VKYKKTLAGAVFLMFLGGCSKEKGASRATTEEPLIKGVEVVAVRPESVADTFESVGTVKARQSAALSSKIIGTIVGVSVREGDHVKRGQTLIEIDSRDLAAELRGAQAAVEEANSAIKAGESAVSAARGQRELAAATFKRYESLVAKGSVTPQEFDEVSAKYRVANAELERAEENQRAAGARKKQTQAKVAYAQTLFEYSRITAPFDGVVTAKNAEVGMLASPGVALMTVEQSGLYRLEAQVGESLLAHVTLGMAVPVAVDAVDAALTGKVGEIVPAADPQSRTFTIKIDLPTHPRLRSGLYGKASFSRGQKQTLLLPVPAVLERGQLTGVFVAGHDGRAEFRLVKTGKRYGERFEILSGLSAGERVVVKGAERIAEGSRVALSAAK